VVISDTIPYRPPQYGTDFTTTIQLQSLHQVPSLHLLHLQQISKRNDQKKFHTRGPAVAKHRSPYVLCARRTTLASTLQQYLILKKRKICKLTQSEEGIIADNVIKLKYYKTFYQEIVTKNQHDQE